ncbi:hypothetical protein FJ872_09055 [Mesorhizobium sp. B2-5-9]|uniref:hypothetical protein n=1 Tax=unclassified Mesorhizobium TaxID=325217 RepID=UPI00112E242E|nr:MULTISPECIES: hypothetical protein [unclassified Mesorhizobium]MBZ9697477.1 hypothetical protein [Mesorhizobium sp. CO1-1-9]TPK13105.1 hypothetical protein FJ543_14920 [Mesorhizobium sp. B2-5-7]TPK21420.1 hypothetical protein FJ872_09055 [Mesorhizobium sp. B2-5-9]TPK80811.1 hypothetical protein FJ527_03310 [Mesorhizobium sp. B2-4-18]TPK87757.1 hypothetical protein FJ936_01335 [Mesorhizobium sp. B2-4-13]
MAAEAAAVPGDGMINGPLARAVRSSDRIHAVVAPNSLHPKLVCHLTEINIWHHHGGHRECLPAKLFRMPESFSIVDCQPAGCVYAVRTGTAEEG